MKNEHDGFVQAINQSEQDRKHKSANKTIQDVPSPTHKLSIYRNRLKIKPVEYELTKNSVNISVPGQRGPEYGVSRAHSDQIQNGLKRLSFSDQQVQARYDSAQTTPENRRHWAMADSYSADAGNSENVRKTIRERARYEYLNNTYAKGLVLNISNDTVGTGPKLQLTDTRNPDMNTEIERSFAEWSEEVSLPAILRTLKSDKTVTGESFAILASCPHLRCDVKLLPVPIEADRVTAEFTTIDDPLNIDGVILDSFGRPIRYTYTATHPGSGISGFGKDDYRSVDEQYMIHWFRADRSEQHRGISEIVAALPLFAQLRRYTLAALEAAELAANISAVVYTDLPGGIVQRGEPFEELTVPRGTQVVLPDGWKMSQYKPEQPVNTYPEYKRALLSEIGRCLVVPVNVMTGDSSSYNYSSGRLDHKIYHKSIQIEQDDMVRVVLNKIFRHWSREWLLSKGMNQDTDLPHVWYFDGFEPIDPVKTANAQDTMLKNGLTNLAREAASRGVDWEVEMEQSVREAATLREKLDDAGMSINDYWALKGCGNTPDSISLGDKQV